MVDIPFEVLLNSDRGIGAVYYYLSDHLVQTNEPHYCVVLAHTDSKLYVVPATSKIEKRKIWAKNANLPDATLVEVNPTERNGLQIISLFDCNSIIEESLYSLRQKHTEKPIQIKGVMEDEIIEKMLIAVKISPMITPVQKRALGLL